MSSRTEDEVLLFLAKNAKFLPYRTESVEEKKASFLENECFNKDYYYWCDAAQSKYHVNLQDFFQWWGEDKWSFNRMLKPLVDKGYINCTISPGIMPSEFDDKMNAIEADYSVSPSVRYIAFFFGDKDPNDEIIKHYQAWIY